MSEADFAVLSDDHVYSISKVYHKKKHDVIWISSKFSKKPKIIDKIQLNKIEETEFSKLLGKGYICFPFQKNKLIIFRPPRGQFFIINKDLVINEDLAWLIGFYLAEGSKKNKNGIGVSNKELCLIDKNIELFKNVFGVPRDSWKFFIKTNVKDAEKLELIRRSFALN